MKKLALICLSILAALGQSFAATEAPAVETKNKSSFAMEATTRNPYWPIGWKPVAKLADSGSDRGGADIPVTAFVVSSITVEKNGHFAIINGKIMGEGQVFGLQVNGQTFQITVKAIEDGKVTLARRDQEITVPLRRK